MICRGSLITLIQATLLLVFGGLMPSVVAQDQLTSNKPQAVFDELWTTFSHRYAFFELRGVDWDAIYDIDNESIWPAVWQ